MTTLIAQLAIAFVFMLSPAELGQHPSTNPEASQERTGAITGKIEIHAAPQLMRMERGARYRSGAAARESEAMAENVNEQRNVVVYLEGEKLDEVSIPRNGKVVMDQKKATFIPHVLAIQKGTEVDFVNHDRVYHNVFSLSAPKKFNIGRRPTGEGVPVKFDKQGVVQIFCDIHSQMTAFVVVLENSFFVQPDEDGTFKIDLVPPGTYTLKVWHERLAAPEQKITVTSGGTAKANFVLE